MCSKEGTCVENAAMNVTCPSCGAALRFDGREQKLTCASCGTEFAPEAMREADEAIRQSRRESESNWNIGGNRAWSEAEREQLNGYSCPSCGATIVADGTTAATECVYCGNSSILPARLQGDFRPDAILPFVKTKEDAKAAYRQLISGKRLLPKLFSREGRIEKITGVYVPFWMFDCQADADIAYRATRSHAHTEGDYIVTETDHYLVRRGGDVQFAGVPVDGSTKFADDLMDSIEPFDHAKEVAFSAAYLPGYQAERYDVNAEAAKPRADERIRQSVIDGFTGTVTGYSSVSMESASVRIGSGRVRNVMIPVWMLNTRWKDKTYTFAMNGQTGRIVGNLPVDGGLALKWGLGVFGGAFVVLTAAAFALIAMGVM